MNTKTILVVAASLCLGASIAVAQTTAKKATKKKIAAAAPAAVVLADASAEQMAAAQRAFTGQYQCEFSQTLDVSMNQKPGYLDVRHQKQVYTMKPVLSSTGALRLEDVRGRTLLLQIANKSMLMDQMAGKRVVDGCIHEKQRAVAAAMAK